MTAVRNDDVLGVFTRGAPAPGGRKPKILQTWEGEIGVRIRSAREAALVAEALEQKLVNPRWSVRSMIHRDAAIYVQAAYTAKGANADDAEKIVWRALDTVSDRGEDLLAEPIAVKTFNIKPAV